MMIENVLYKHVTLGLNNGIIIEGFVQNKDENYFRIVEKTNNIVIIRIEDISFAKFQEATEEIQNTITEQQIKGSSEDFSMPAPNQGEMYQKPTFLRVTPRK